MKKIEKQTILESIDALGDLETDIARTNYLNKVTSEKVLEWFGKINKVASKLNNIVKPCSQKSTE